MNRRAPHSRSHPVPELLALYSRGDISVASRFRIRQHLRQCPECEHQVALFGAAITELKREAATETLTAFEAIADWRTLEREMLGNIAVGVAAARCIEKVGHKPSWWPKAALAAGLTILFFAGWLSHIPGEETSRLALSLSRSMGFHSAAPRLRNVVETTPTGIAVRSEGVTLMFLHPPSAVVSMSGNSSVEARYVDEDTGQLTITNVYGQ